MLLVIVKETIELALIVAFLFFVLREYVHSKQPSWAEPLEKRHLTILLMLIFAVTAIEVAEDVIDGDSGPSDEAILLFIHNHASQAVTAFFQAITLAGSSKVLAPVTTIAAIVLWFSKRRYEAILLASSVITASIVVYLLKMAVGRERPALWDTEWYWGSSFPSGHTLVFAAFATATVICIGRLWPAAHKVALVAGLSGVVLVGLSRLVLGVHWPTDVLAAACIGMFLPLAINVALEIRQA